MNLKEAKEKFSNCTKCENNLIVIEHMCSDCYEKHNTWLNAANAPEIEQDSYITLYESK